jgi:hypothetical protein
MKQIPEEEYDRLVTERDALRARAEKAEAFKAFVHDRLDRAGVPFDPDPAHNAACGCRIGGRLDHLIGERDALRQRLSRPPEAAS